MKHYTIKDLKKLQKKWNRNFYSIYKAVNELSTNHPECNILWINSFDYNRLMKNHKDKIVSHMDIRKAPMRYGNIILTKNDNDLIWAE